MTAGSSVWGSARRGSGVPVGDTVQSTVSRMRAQRARSSAAKAASVRARATSAVTWAL